MEPPSSIGRGFLHVRNPLSVEQPSSIGRGFRTKSGPGQTGEDDDDDEDANHNEDDLRFTRGAEPSLRGRTPTAKHPQFRDPHRSFDEEQEAAIEDLRRVAQLGYADEVTTWEAVLQITGPGATPTRLAVITMLRKEGVNKVRITVGMRRSGIKDRSGFATCSSSRCSARVSC